jgi:hypothetical protein
MVAGVFAVVFTYAVLDYGHRRRMKRSYDQVSEAWGAMFGVKRMWGEREEDFRRRLVEVLSLPPVIRVRRTRLPVDPESN